MRIKGELLKTFLTYMRILIVFLSYFLLFNVIFEHSTNVLIFIRDFWLTFGITQ